MNPFADLMRDVVAPEADEARTRLALVSGVVTAVNTGGANPTVDVDLAGGIVPELRFPQGAAPVIGDVAWVLMQGGAAMFVQVVLA
ncbi:hypothetical protein [Modestobacter sp. KNN46-3]|uniref:hypothetical protein n=1 Tax=Modestobacter sp. KNN46-3 TaxID=2711218 RepID=UPI0013DF89DF|nr:hypothetical protein [Modestobacter sp. KNN46-3]